MLQVAIPALVEYVEPLHEYDHMPFFRSGAALS